MQISFLGEKVYLIIAQFQCKLRQLRGKRAFLKSTGFCLASAQNNTHVKVTHFEVVNAVPLHNEKGNSYIRTHKIKATPMVLSCHKPQPKSACIHRKHLSRNARTQTKFSNSALAGLLYPKNRTS